MKPSHRPAVEVNELTVRFGEFTAVNRISFAVEPGEIFGFLGANGAGKTTTIRVLCGLLVPSSGTARVAGLSFARGQEDAIKARVGYMSQKFTLYDDLTVAENLAFAAALRKLDDRTLARRKKELFDFIQFSRPESTFVKDLPGGVKQQVSLAASLLHEPEIVFLDEPTAGVTPAARARFWNLIRSLSEAGKTVFVTTHYMDEAEQCGRIALMRAGEIIALDSPAELKARTFPEPILEIEVPPDAPSGWIARVRGMPEVVSLEPHGMRFHAVLRDKAGRVALENALAGFATRTVPPSLEDVFIRLVEGDGK